MPPPSAPPPHAPANLLPLSVSVICKDNERTIGRTFDSVRGLASEIIVVDSGSTDGTLELAEQAGATIHRTDWPGFIEQQRRALALCAQPWILILDSDESIDDELAHAVRDAIEKDEPGILGYEINRKVYWNNTPLHHAWQPEWRLRLIRKNAATWGGYDPHYELHLLKEGRTGKLVGTMRHDAILSIGEFLERQVVHGRVAAKSLAANGTTGNVRKLVTSPIGAWFKMMFVRGAYKDGWRGWVAGSSVALAAIAKHAALLEITRSKGDDRE